MTPDKQRIAIAEACGWTKCRLTIRGSGAPERRPSPHGYPPGKNYEAPITDYLNDLNAMHEAEKQFLDGPNRYWTILLEITDMTGRTMDWRHFGHATAKQRAEAFLKEKNLWR